MTDDYFFDRDGNPLTGKIPLSVEFTGPGDPTPVQGEASGALQVFLTDIRLGGLSQLRAQERLSNGGYIDMRHVFGQTYVEVFTPKPEPSDSEFYGGILLSPCRSPTHEAYTRGYIAGTAFSNISDLAFVNNLQRMPELASSGTSLKKNGRPAVPGATDPTDWIVVQIAKGKRLDDQPVKKGAVKIWRITNPKFGSVVESRSDRAYLLSTYQAPSVYGGPPSEREWYYCGKVVESIPQLPTVSRLAGILSLRTFDFLAPSFIDGNKAQGIVIVALTDGRLYAVNTRDRTDNSPAQWKLLASADPFSFSQAARFGTTFTIERQNNTVILTCSGAVGNMTLSGYVVRIRRQPGGVAPELTGELRFAETPRRDAVPGFSNGSFSISCSAPPLQTASVTASWTTTDPFGVIPPRSNTANYTTYYQPYSIVLNNEFNYQSTQPAAYADSFTGLIPQADAPLTLNSTYQIQTSATSDGIWYVAATVPLSEWQAGPHYFNEISDFPGEFLTGGVVSNSVIVSTVAATGPGYSVSWNTTRTYGGATPVITSSSYDWTNWFYFKPDEVKIIEPGYKMRWSISVNRPQALPSPVQPTLPDNSFVIDFGYLYRRLGGFGGLDGGWPAPAQNAYAFVELDAAGLSMSAKIETPTATVLDFGDAARLCRPAPYEDIRLRTGANQAQVLLHLGAAPLPIEITSGAYARADVFESSMVARFITPKIQTDSVGQFLSYGSAVPGTYAQFISTAVYNSGTPPVFNFIENGSFTWTGLSASYSSSGGVYTLTSAQFASEFPMALIAKPAFTSYVPPRVKFFGPQGGALGVMPGRELQAAKPLTNRWTVLYTDPRTGGYVAQLYYGWGIGLLNFEGIAGNVAGSPRYILETVIGNDTGWVPLMQVLDEWRELGEQAKDAIGYIPPLEDTPYLMIYPSAKDQFFQLPTAPEVALI